MIILLHSAERICAESNARREIQTAKTWPRAAQQKLIFCFNKTTILKINSYWSFLVGIFHGVDITINPILTADYPLFCALARNDSAVRHRQNFLYSKILCPDFMQIITLDWLNGVVFFSLSALF